MGATEILKVLEKGEPMSMVEISQLVDCGISPLRKSMARLLRDHISNIKVKRLTSEEVKKKYGKCRAGRTYIYWIEK